MGAGWAGDRPLRTGALLVINQDEKNKALCHCQNGILVTKIPCVPHFYVAHGSRGAEMMDVRQLCPSRHQDKSQVAQGPSPLAFAQVQHWCLTFFLFFFFLPPCYLNGFKHETRPGKGGSIVLIISNYDRCNINCIFP